VVLVVNDARQGGDDVVSLDGERSEREVARGRKRDRNPSAKPPSHRYH
jgi:hypothetical protein